MTERYEARKRRFVERYLSTWVGYRIFCLRVAALGGVVGVGFLALLIFRRTSTEDTIARIVALALLVYYTGRTIWLVRVVGGHVRRGDPDPGDYAALQRQLRGERWRRRRSP
jgi:hypothetical protein